MTNPQLQDALFKAAKVGHIELARELIKVGADPFALDKSGRDAFFYAEKQNPEEAEVLLEELKASKEGQNA